MEFLNYYQNRRALFAAAAKTSSATEPQGRRPSVTSGLALSGHLINPVPDHVTPIDYATFVVDELDAQVGSLETKLIKELLRRNL